MYPAFIAEPGKYLDQNRLPILLIIKDNPDTINKTVTSFLMFCSLTFFAASMPRAKAKTINGSNMATVFNVSGFRIPVTIYSRMRKLLSTKNTKPSVPLKEPLSFAVRLIQAQQHFQRKKQHHKPEDDFDHLRVGVFQDQRTGNGP